MRLIRFPQFQALALAAVFFLFGCSKEEPLKKAEEKIRQFDYAGAREILENVVKKDSNNVDAMAMLLRVHWLANDTVSNRSLRAMLSGRKILALAQFHYEVGNFDSVINSAQNVGLEEQKQLLLKAQMGKIAEVIADSGNQFLNRSDFRNAVIAFSQADSILTKLEHNYKRSAILSARASARQYIGELKEATQDIVLSRTLAQGLGSHYLSAKAFQVSGILEDRQDKYEAAIRYFQQAIEHAEKDGTRSLELKLRAQTNLSSSLMRIGKIPQAEAELINIISGASSFPRVKVVALNRYAILLHRKGTYSKAIRFYEESLGLAKAIGNRLLESSNISGIGDVYFFQDNYPKASEYTNKAIQISESLGDKSAVATNYVRLAQIENFTGGYRNAIAKGKKALAIAEELEEMDVAARARYSIGQSHQALRDFPTAISIFRQVIESAQEIQSLELLTASITSLNNCYVESGIVPDSTQELEASVKKSKERGEHYAHAFAGLALARIIALKGKTQEALSLMNECQKSAREIGALELIADGFEGIGDISNRMLNNDQASTAYEEAARTREQIGLGLLSGQERSTYFDKARRLTEKQIEAVYDSRRFAKVIGLLAQAKSRTLLTLIATRQLKTKNRTDSVTLEQELNLRGNVARSSLLLSEAYNSGESTRSLKTPSLTKDLEQAQAAYSQFLYEQELNNPRLSSVLSVPKITVKDIQPIIPANAILLDYILLEDKLIVCALKRSGELKVFATPIARTKLRDDVGLLRSQMQKKWLKENVWKKLSVRFESVLLDSLKASGVLNGVELLIVSPDDVLHYVPFQLLHDGKQFLAERFAIVNYPSASVMKLMHQLVKPKPLNKYLAMAYSDGSIPNAELEVQTIRNVIGGATTTLIGKAATKDTLEKISAKFDVIHIAAHGVPALRDPLLSALQLAPTKTSDGKLMVHEMFDLRLDNSLVVLSGCETGVEKAYQPGISPGGEVIGQVRALIFAGASSVVSTLWKVDDKASSEFMRHFYENFKKAQNVTVALRKAQQAMIANPSYRHPYYWAAYVVTGM